MCIDAPSYIGFYMYMDYKSKMYVYPYAMIHCKILSTILFYSTAVFREVHYSFITFIENFIMWR